jgi:molecular chaperone Hsp33
MLSKGVLCVSRVIGQQCGVRQYSRRYTVRSSAASGGKVHGNGDGNGEGSDGVGIDLNVGLPTSVLLSTLTQLGGVNIKAVDLSQVVKDITSRHGCSPLASVALGRALVGNVLLAAGREEGMVSQLSINGNGPLDSINTEVMFSPEGGGVVRGYVGNPTADLPLVGGLLDVSGGVGIGVLKVCHKHPTRPQKTQEGTTMLETSEIGEDLVVYLLSSEQINSAMGLGVQIDETKGIIRSAVGFLCTVLPGCTEEELVILEQNIAKVNQLNEFMNVGNSIHDLMTSLSNNLGEQYRNRSTLVRRCSCSKEKFIESFKLLGRKELQDIIEKDEKDETIRCHWCNSELSIRPSSLKPLLDTTTDRKQDSSTTNV